MEKEDLIKYKAFKQVVANGDYEVKGSAMLAVASLIKWFYELEPKIHEAIAMTENKKSIAKSKPVKEPISK